MENRRSDLKPGSIKAAKAAALIILFACMIFAPAGAELAYAKKVARAGNSFFARLWNFSVKPERDGKDVCPKSPAAPAPLNAKYKTYRVVIDPGHGGKSEKSGLTEGDHWDIKAKRFLTRYNYGAYHGDEAEHRIVLDICRMTAEILKSANTDAGWREFSKLLAAYGVKRPNEYRRVNFDTAMTREKSFEAPEFTAEANVNKHFRLFDSPESFDAAKKPSPALHPGRMSKINALTPELVLCVHVNSSTNSRARGQASVVIPGYRVFDFVKTVKTRLGVKSALTYFWLLAWFYPDNPVLGNLSRLINDCETYFTGKRSDNKSRIGKRWQMVKWRYCMDDEYDNLLNYKDNDSYWKRERSDYESMRRDGGITGAGGDNFYASEEFIKFIRFGLWQDYMNGSAKGVTELSGLKSPGEYLGPHGAPFISDWALPQMVNAVTAYIELGYIENDADRFLLTSKKDVIARSLAVATYSLTEGFEPKKLPLSKEELIKNTPPLKAMAAAAVPRTLEKAVEQRKRIVKLVDNLKKELKGGGKLESKQPLNKDAGEEEAYFRTPLVLPLAQRINFEKYGDYFKSVLKQK
jgi:N-acetylmuramoyl-L-alanine amidase